MIRQYTYRFAAKLVKLVTKLRKDPPRQFPVQVLGRTVSSICEKLVAYAL